MAELSGRELDRAIAVALGWRPFQNSNLIRDVWFVEKPGSGQKPILPAFHADANVQIDVCVDRRLSLWFENRGGVVTALCHKPKPDGTFDICNATGNTWQEAGARALLSILELGS